MIRKMTEDNIVGTAVLLYQMYREVFPNDCTDDIAVYIKEIVRCMIDPKQAIFIDTDLRGFFIVVDSSEPMTPTLKRYEGTRVYILPEHRGKRLLSEFYSALFREYPEGDLIGFTEIGSKHIPILEKRHTRIANVYKLTRS